MRAALIASEKEGDNLMAWGDKGEEYRPDRCEHGPDEGCMWCCRLCNLDRHLCGGCGTPVGHKDFACEDCKKLT